jgi:long-chain acyl-CoA synthetase
MTKTYGDVDMPKLDELTRLEERFTEAWRGRENENCLWWQGEWWSWNRLNDLAIDCENKLKNSGFQKGQRIVVILPNSPMIFALSVAAWRLKGSIAPLNGRVGMTNIVDTVKLLDPHSMLTTEEFSNSAKDTFDAIGVPIVPIKPDAPLNEWKGRMGLEISEDYAVEFATSGTTGNPKAVGCLHSNIIDNIKMIPIQVPGLLDSSSIFLNVLPNFHTFGNNVAGLLPLLTGVRQVVVPSFLPVDTTIDAMRQSGCNVIIGVPTVIFDWHSCEKRRTVGEHALCDVRRR